MISNKNLYLKYLLVLFTITSCYKFQGVSSISKEVKTIQIEEILNNTSQLPPELVDEFYQNLQNFFQNKANLIYTKSDGDISISGEFTHYNSRPTNISYSDGLAQESQIKVVVKIRWTNKKEPQRNNEKDFTDEQCSLSEGETLSDGEKCTSEIANRLALAVFNAIANEW